MEVKTSEEIRDTLDVTQHEFARMIGLARRTYIARIVQEQDWKFKDLVYLTSLNDGKVKIKNGNEFYIVSIKKC